MKNTQQKENRATFIARIKKHTEDQKEIDTIMFAYDMAKETHRRFNRDTGERYFEHLRRGVIIMLDELEWYDKNSIYAILLHDSGEDTGLLGNRTNDYDEFVRTAHFRLDQTFGSEVAELVIALTKPVIDGKTILTKEQAETTYFIGLQKNRKALFLKMIDRLDNLRSLASCKKEKQKKIFKETEEKYLPIFETLLEKSKYIRQAYIIYGTIEDILEELDEKLNGKPYKLICQKWEESEAGWGARPDGYSLHLSYKDLEKFIENYWSRMPKSVPDVYSRPDGTPYICKVTQRTYKEVKKAKVGREYGIWGTGQHPDGGTDGWLREEERKIASKNPTPKNNDSSEYTDSIETDSDGNLTFRTTNNNSLGLDT